MQLQKLRDHLVDKLRCGSDNVDLTGDEFGHISGSVMEKWVCDNLSDIHGWEIKCPHEFMNELHNYHKEKKMNHTENMNNTWWSKIVLPGKPREEGNYVKSQQEGADLMLCCDGFEQEILQKVKLINVKSHNMDRDGRHPNILSSLRLLEFISHTLNHENSNDFIDNMNYWIISIYHSEGKIMEVHAKDLFLLDVEQLPMINFDAALQIQWHVDKMVEIPGQLKIKFICNFKNRFIDEWKKHKLSKDTKYNELISGIEKKLRSWNV